MMSANGSRIYPPKYYYNQMSIEQAQCRARGRHIFPDLDPATGILPQGFRIISHDRFGRYFTEEQCTKCGRFRFGVMEWADGHMVRIRRANYADPEGWVRAPRGVLTQKVISQLLLDACAKMIKAAARQSELV
jgi:hypothetical protein